MKIADIRKAISCATALAADLIAAGVLHGTVREWTMVGITLAGTVTTYLVPNRQQQEVRTNEPARQSAS